MAKFIMPLQWVAADAAHGGHIYRSLVRHHKKRRKQRCSLRRRLFAGRVSISQRPKIVADKVRFGDWESDSMEGGKSKGCNFHEISHDKIQAVVDRLNHRPRKCLNFRTPYEVLFKTKTVALGM